MYDAGELAAEAAHAALKPIAAMAGDYAGEEFDDTEAVGADDDEDEHTGIANC